jgi:carboxyl-terminal processing protease
MGERDIDNAMPWDKIDPAEYKFWDKQNNFDKAIDNSKKRIAMNEKFKLIEENAKWIDERNKENIYSLNIDKFKADQAEVEQKAKKYKVISDYKNQLQFSSLPNEIEAMKTDITLKEKRERWHESLSKDIYVEEAINILDDLQPKGIVKKNVSAVKKDKLVKH